MPLRRRIVDEVFEAKKVRMQRQIDALAKQITILSIAMKKQQQQQQPRLRNPYFDKDEKVIMNLDSFSSDSQVNWDFPPSYDEYREEVMEEIIVKGDVGDFLDDIEDEIEIDLEGTIIHKIFSEEEFDDILLDINTLFLESQVDWNLLPKFDEYLVENEIEIHEVKEKFRHREYALTDGCVYEILQFSDAIELRKYDQVEELKNDSNGVILFVSSKEDKNSLPYGFDQKRKPVEVEMGMDLFQQNYHPWSFHYSVFEDQLLAAAKRNFCSQNLYYKEDGLNLMKKIIYLISEDSRLQFRFEKINLKYKVDADQCRRTKLFQVMETRGRVFSSGEE